MTSHGLGAVAEWEAEYRALSADELASADRLLDEAGVGIDERAEPPAASTKPRMG